MSSGRPVPLSASTSVTPLPSVPRTFTFGRIYFDCAVAEGRKLRIAAAAASPSTLSQNTSLAGAPGSESPASIASIRLATSTTPFALPTFTSPPGCTNIESFTDDLSVSATADVSARASEPSARAAALASAVSAKLHRRPVVPSPRARA